MRAYVVIKLYVCVCVVIKLTLALFIMHLGLNKNVPRHMQNIFKSKIR